MTTRDRVACAALCTALCGCSPVWDRSALSPGGPAARRLAELGWPILVGFTAVSVVVWGLLVWLALRRRGSLERHAPAGHDAGQAWIWVGGVAVPVAVFGTLIVLTMRTLAAFPLECGQPVDSVVCGTGGDVDARITGRQWWWSIRYVRGGPTQWATTANELHIPVGRPFDVELVSDDVIHSFWVPRLHGKVDLVPGHVNHIRIHADAPGVYPGECAEFCGRQHAHMRLLVVAEPPADYERWLERQRAPAAAPTDEAAQRGNALFESGACQLCHSVRGTRARGTFGPDLTHLAGRRIIAASLPNDLATLHAWVTNAPSLKDGTQMPALTEFDGPELHDLVAYLETLE